MSNELSELMSIEYPGFVKNLDKMIETVGGFEKMKKTFEDPPSRLEVSLRPKNVFAHPLMGDRVSTNNLLVKCCRKKVISELGEVSFTYEATITGLVTVTYKFNSLADFQYLPMERISSGSQLTDRYKSIYNDILPDKPYESLKSFNENAPLFLIPTIFSRFDFPLDYHYRDGPNSRSNGESSSEKDLSVITGTRKTRSILPMFVSWEEEIPTEPHPRILQKTKINPSNSALFEELKKCFQQKPIWSRNALLYKLKCHPADLKHLLPRVAYYFPNGPFRCQWVKYGFDPKKNKSCKIYQTLDFRIKQSIVKGDCSDKISAKRATLEYNPVRKRESQKKTQETQGSIINSSLLSIQATSKEFERNECPDEQKLLASFVFTPGTLPSCRQVHYQLCDIKVDAVKKLIHSNDNNEPEECHDKDGWCGEDVIDQIRCILSYLTDEMLKKDDRNLDPVFSEEESENFLTSEYLDYFNEDS